MTENAGDAGPITSGLNLNPQHHEPPLRRSTCFYGDVLRLVTETVLTQLETAWPHLAETRLPLPALA